MKTFSLVVEQQNPTFETIEELLRDQTEDEVLNAGWTGDSGSYDIHRGLIAKE